MDSENDNIRDIIDFQATSLSESDNAEQGNNADTFLSLVNIHGKRMDSEINGIHFQATSQCYSDTTTTTTTEQDNADSDTDRDDGKRDPENPRVKRKCSRKLHGSAVYSTAYQKLWEKKYDFIQRSSLFPRSHFHCKVCNKDVSTIHPGAADIERHAECKSHQQRVKPTRNQSRLSFNTSSSDSSGSGNEVTAAEVRNTMMIAHHNAALCLADHIGGKNFLIPK